MSDFSSLYKKYDSVSQMTDTLNIAVMAIKRRALASKPGVKQQHPNLDVSDTELSKARKEVEHVLSELAKFYNEPQTKDELYELMDNSLFKNQILMNEESRGLMLSALEKIRAGSNLTRRELDQLDIFISILDNEAGVLFRKLRSSR